MIVLLFLAIFSIIILANVIDASDTLSGHQWFDHFMLVINLILIFLGGAFFLITPETLSTFVTLAVALEPQAIGLTLLFIGIWGTLVSFQAVRRLITIAIPIQSTSAVHTLTLVLVGYLVGNTLLTVLLGGLEELAETTVSASIFDVILQQALFALLGILGVGLFVRRTGADLWQRLGLERPSIAQLWLGLRWIGGLLVLQWLIGAIWYLFDPVQSELVEGISNELLAGFDTVGEWFILAMAAGIGEEVLFRGALQPVLGLPLTAVLFAVSHVQYGITPVTFAILIIGFALGFIRQRTNTTVAIFVHFGYNFVLGLLALLAQWLETAVQ